MPDPTNPDPSGSIEQQILQTAGFYPPIAYDLLTRYGSLITKSDDLSTSYIGLTSVQPPANTETLPFAIGFIPPPAPTMNLVSREASVAQNNNTAPPATPGTAIAQNATRLATTSSGSGQTTVAGVNGLQVPGVAGSNGGPPVVTPLNYQQVASVIAQAYQDKYGATPNATTLSMLTAQSFRENGGNWPNNNPGMIGNYDVPTHVAGQYSPSTTRSTWGFARGTDSSGNITASYFNSYDTPQQGATAFLNQIPPAALQAASNGDVQGYCNALYAVKYFTTPGPDQYAAGFANLSFVQGQIGSVSNLSSVQLPTPSQAVSSDTSNNGSWNNQQGSQNSQQAAAVSDSVANTTLNTSALGQQFVQAQQAQANALTQLVNQMASTPPLRLLVNPRSFKTGLEKITADGNWGRNGPIIEHWGEQLDKIEGSGKIAAFFALDTSPPNANVNDSSSSGPGLSRMARNYSTSYQNFLSLYLIYRSNGGIWTTDTTTASPQAGTQPSPVNLYLQTVGSVYLYYDHILYVGAFDNFTISEADEAPFSLEYSFTFTVRAWFELDAQQDPMLSFNPPVNATPGNSPTGQPGTVQVQNDVTQFGPAAGQPSGAQQTFAQSQDQALQAQTQADLEVPII